MSFEKTGGPAFPVSTINPKDGHQDSTSTWQFPGMTLRDHFAGLAMQGMCAGSQKHYPNEIARLAYTVADEMLKAREA